MLKKRMVWVIGFTFMLVGESVPAAFAESDCPSLEKQPVKIEGYISKKFKKQRKAIFKEFAEMGNTRVRLKVFPMGKTAKNMAIGRCVPVHIAQHALQKALEYSGGVENLVNQAFYSPHWVGVGTTIFDEPSQQKVTQEQVNQLLDSSLSTEEFQELYRKFSIQDDKVPYFGLKVPNVKRAK